MLNKSVIQMHSSLNFFLFFKGSLFYFFNHEINTEINMQKTKSQKKNSEEMRELHQLMCPMNCKNDYQTISNHSLFLVLFQY